MLPAMGKLSWSADLRDLPRPEADELERLLQQARLDAAPPASDPGRAPDQFSYEIDVIEDGGRTRSIALGDVDLTDATGPLIRWLVGRARSR